MPESSAVASVTLVALPRTSAALEANGQSCLREARIVAPRGLTRGKLRLALGGHEPASAPYVAGIEDLAEGGAVSVRLDAVCLPLSLLAGRSERTTVEVVAELLDAQDAVVARDSARIVVLPASHWAWGGTDAASIAAFVTPNAPQLADVLRDASRRLEARTGSGAIDGYASSDKRRPQYIAEACMEALSARIAHYVLGRVGFEADGQKVRTAGEVVDEGAGNCLDLACASAALWELAGLRPVLAFGDGHAIAGFFVADDLRFPAAETDGVSGALTRLDMGELRLLDATSMSGADRSFAAALATGEGWLRAERRSAWIVDIGEARKLGIHPLADALERRGSGAGLGREPRAEPWQVRLPAGLGRVEKLVRSRKEQRFDGWLKRLLDLTLRNRLLNDRWSDGGVHIALEGDAALDALEHALRAETSLRLLAGQSRTQALVGDAARQEIGRGFLPTMLDAEALRERVVKLAREGRSSLEETGARSLHVALGFLEYGVEGRSSPLRAPLLLAPVDFEGAAGRRDAVLRSVSDDAVVNAALGEYMRQVHRVDLGLDAALPQDEDGLDVPLFLARVRQAVKDIPGCSVLSRAKLGTWSFKKLPLVEELRAREPEMLAHPLVSVLLERGGGLADASALPGPEEVEAAARRETLRLPLAADSSQIAAVLGAMSGASFVLQGPPGTGKSQTITNLLAEALARGKRVLFLAEKSAALQVVAKRLERAGLGASALNLHAEEATKTRFVAQVKAALDALDGRAAPGAGAFASTGAAYDEACAALARVKALLHDAGEGELALHAAVDLAVAARAALGAEPPRCETPPQASLARAALRDAQSGAARLAHAWSRLPAQAALELRDMDCARPASEAAAREAASALRALREDLEALARALPVLGSVLGCAPAADAAAAQRQVDLTGFLADDHECVPALARAAGAADAVARFAACARTIELERAAQAAESALEAGWDKQVLQTPLVALLGELRASREQFFVAAWFARRRVRKQLVPWAKRPLPKELDGLLASVQSLVDAKQALDGAFAAASEIAQLRGAAARLDVEGAARRLEAARSLHKRLAAEEPRLLSVLQAAAPLAGSSELRAALQGAASPLQRMADARAHAELCLGLASPAARAAAGVFADERARLERWLRHEAEWVQWSLYAAQRQLMARAGFAPLAAALEEGRVQPAAAETAALAGLSRAHVEGRLRSDLALGDCFGERSATLRAQLHERAQAYEAGVSAAVEAQVRRRAKTALDALSKEKDPSRKDSLKRLNELRAQTTIRRAIRRVMRESAPAIAELKPIVLASPLSAAVYLPPDFPQFDLVVIDEASQVPVWDAACALSRGRSAVVVGDSKQLPPTNFFDRRESADEADQEAAEGAYETLESVLDECVAAGLPQMSLLWHYRSRDERLVEYANRRSYGGRLQTFPASHRTHPDLGVEFRLVKGVYDRSTTRTNRIEAEAVVAEALRRLRDPRSVPANRSIGIVTFSLAQQTLVQDLLDAALEAEPALAARAADTSAGEPLFVKNLESVQGDERATLLFSVGYGPDAQGKLHYNFGPLNMSGGERRLNVAITRAREKVVVFASMRAVDLDPAKCGPKGVQDLRGYLDYAETGMVPAADERGAHARIDVSALESDLARRLREAGWLVDLHVGRSRDYRVSLALARPDAPERWILGVELDGAHWAAAPTVVDRELVRAGVLAALGWRIERVAALDLWRDPSKVASRIDAAARSLVKSN